MADTAPPAVPPPPVVQRRTINTTALYSKSLLLLLALSFATYASQLALHPLYGSVASSVNFGTLTLIACLSSSVLPIIPPRYAFLFIGCLLQVSPQIAYHVGALTARRGNPMLGPMITHACTVFPVVLIAAKVFHTWAVLVLVPLMPRAPERNVSSGTRLVAWLGLNGFEMLLWRFFPKQALITSCNIFRVTGAAFAAAAAYESYVYFQQLPPPSKPVVSKGSPPPPKTLTILGAPISSVFFALPFLLASISHVQPPCLAPSYPHLLPQSNVRILAKEQSTTGMVITAEYLDGPYRFLRVDHSLLGGKWLTKYQKGAESTEESRLGESVYSAFVLQEAVRLVKRDQKKKEEKALIIGLGIGIAAAGLHSHGVSTTILEIDEAVYKQARSFFGLPDLQPVYFENARWWVNGQSWQLANGNASIPTYDYVVHDLFSGGSVPAKLYTDEFWKELKSIMKPDGVLAVNYAGVVDSDSSRAILATLKNTFGPCRVFHDQVIDEHGKGESYEFLNMVFFCTASSSPVTFRPPKKEDYLRSYLRQNILDTIPAREVDQSTIYGNSSTSKTAPGAPPRKNVVITMADNPLGEWQEVSSFEHWKVMRDVLPAAVWEAY